VQRRVDAGTVPARTVPDGVLTIARCDVRLIVPGEPADTDRRAVMLRPTLERHAAWVRASAAADQPVSVWLGELADRGLARRAHSSLWS
jgi:hypothetical protein